MKARVVKISDNHYMIEVQTENGEILPIAETKGIYYEVCKWQTEQEAINYINSRDKLEYCKEF